MAQGIGRLPPLNALRVFEVVTRHLNFRLAAEELGVTQANAKVGEELAKLTSDGQRIESKP